MTPDWHKIGIVSKSDYDRLEQKVDLLVLNQNSLLNIISNLEKSVSTALETQTTNTAAIQKSIDNIKSAELKIMHKEIERVEQLVKISLVNNLVVDIENSK